MERRKDELQPCRRRAVAADIHPTLSKLLGCASENGKLLDVSVQLNFGMKKAEAQARTAEAKNTGCVFCALRDGPSVILRNELIFAIRDTTPVTACTRWFFPIGTLKPISN
jgi:hypothetical protein